MNLGILNELISHEKATDGAINMHVVNGIWWMTKNCAITS